MLKEPCVWFHVCRSINPVKLADFNKLTSGNAGIAFSGFGIQLNGLDLVKEVVAKYEIPLAYYNSSFTGGKSATFDLFEKGKIFNDVGNFDEYSGNTNEIPFMKINLHNKKSLDIDLLLNDLSGYLKIKSLFPESKMAVAINPEDKKAIPELIEIFLKLRFSYIIVWYNESTFNALLPYLNDKEFGLKSAPKDKPAKIDSWRSKIDELDNQIVESIAKRQQIIAEIGDYKSKYHLPLFEAERWNEILTSRKKKAKELDVDETLISKIFEHIHLAALKKMLENK